MSIPLASLYDASVGIHMVFGLLALLAAVALVFLSVLGRKDTSKLETALKLRKVFGPLAGVIMITGNFQIIDGDIKFFQAWLIGGILLLIGAMGAVDGSWAPNARGVVSGEASPE